MASSSIDPFMSTREEIVTNEDIHLLLLHFMRTNHRVKNADIKGETVMERCILLYSLDYQCTIVPNLSGELCSHYPMKLIIPEYEKSPYSTNDVESRNDQSLIYQMFKNARCARCRTRFVVPALLFKGKYICRSATLSGGAEMFGRSTTEYLLSSDNPPLVQGSQDNGRPDMYGKFRGHDIRLLKHFDVKYICDLMVEKKKTKFGMPVTSSEKVDKENRYSDFDILGMPYPGCEFFKDWKENHYCGRTLKYDWRQNLNDSALDLPETEMVKDLFIDWSKYKDWSFIQLTQNYFKLLLNYVMKGSSGLLVHCISGWDRTPLFISLLRISLWADGLVHSSLCATELVYLTLGYDWYLFGHDLPDRLGNGEEVLLFCFKVLKDLASEEYSLSPKPRPASTVNDGGTLPPNQTISMTGPQYRVDSDSSFGIQGVLLDDAVMNFQGKGSTGSLNSLGSSETQDSVKFSIGVPGEQQEEDGGEDGVGAIRRIGSGSSFPSKRRSMSPGTRMSPNRQCSSPVSTGRGSRRLSDGQSLSLHSNHFKNSPPVVRSSSPVVVPERAVYQEECPQGTGSWQIIPSIEGLRLGSSNSQDRDSTERLNSIQEDDIDIKSTVRWQRLNTVSQIFQDIYFIISPAHGKSNTIGAGLSNFFDRLTDSLSGLRNQGVPPPGASRREV